MYIFNQKPNNYFSSQTHQVRGLPELLIELVVLEHDHLALGLDVLLEAASTLLLLLAGRVANASRQDVHVDCSVARIESGLLQSFIVQPTFNEKMCENDENCNMPLQWSDQSYIRVASLTLRVGLKIIYSCLLCI